MAKSPIPKNIHDRQLLVSMERRRGFTATTTSREQRSHSEPLTNRSKEHGGYYGQARGGHMSEAITHRPVDIPVDDADKPSTSLKWIPGFVRMFWRMRGKVRLYKRALFPPLTPDQAEAKEYKTDQKRKDRTMWREGQRVGRLVSDRMLLIANRTWTAAPFERRVRWLGMTRNEDLTKIYLHMDTDPERLPGYVYMSSLPKNSQLIDELTAITGHQVHWQVGIEGCILVVIMDEEKPKRKKILAADLEENDEMDESIYG